MKKTDKTLYLVDGTGLCYRAYYAFKLSTSLGVPSGAIFGYYKTLQKLFKTFQMEYISICFDVARKNIRHQQYAEYKAHRPPTPDELVTQIAAIRELTKYLGLNITEQEGFEADDVIATLTKFGIKQGLKVVIISSDKDMFQLLQDGRVTIYDPYKNKMITEKTFFKDFGFAPVNMLDYLSLVGDASDNVPGAVGIGKVTAGKLIAEYADIETVYAQLNAIKGKTREKLLCSKDAVFLSKDLVHLYDVPMKLKLSDFEKSERDEQSLYSFFSDMEFKNFLKDVKITLNLADSVTVARGIPESFLEQGGDVFFQIIEDNVFIYDEKQDAVFFETQENFNILLNSIDKRLVTFNMSCLPSAMVERLKDKDCFDVKVAAHLTDSGLADYSLEEITAKFCGKRYDKIENEQSPKYIYMLHKQLKQRLQKDKTEKLFYDVEMPLVFILAKMKQSGVSFDLKKAKEIERKVLKELSLARESIFKEAGEDFNLNSPTQISKILFEKLKLPVVKKTKTGYSTNEEVLEKLATDFNIAQLLLAYRKLNKLISTYILPLEAAVKSDGKIHANFNQTATQTGRLSSSSPNLQSIPAKGKFSDELRSAFTTSFSDGVLLACDYSQIELVIMAHFSGEKNLTKVFLSDGDVHTSTAALLFDTREEKVTKEERSIAKRVNFGVLYGMGPYGLARELKVAPYQAQKFIEDYFSRYSEVEKYIHKIEEIAQKKGYISTILGRKRYLPDFKSTNKQLKEFAKRQAVNTPIQGSCADIIKQAMVNIDKEFKEIGVRTKMIMQIHDELIFDGPNNELEKVIPIVKQCMENAIMLTVPVKINIKVGKNWGEMKEYGDI